MGQKVNPIGLRLGINKTWGSRWYVDPREYTATLHEDLRLRALLMRMPECKGADIAELEIIRHPQRITIVIHTARPGVIIGVKGANIEKIGAELQKSIQPRPGAKGDQIPSRKVQIKIKEVRNADNNAQIVAQNIARQLLARGSFRRTMKQAVSNAIKKGNAQGIKVRLSGRLGGAEMSRTEESKEGRIPLHTLRADVDYGFAEAHTTFGAIGVKVWVFNGMKYGKEQKEDAGALVRKRRERTPARS
ncbi:MAG: 30S ribosomal protein S3 [Treponema sp.]|jgi:small subunit ribosomal protein S3|nr:30S ribosomal protein S3 [Treponema sp.]